MLVTYTACV